MFAYLKEHDFVWESGMAGHYTYGPRGLKLKKNIENMMRDYYSELGYEEIDTPLINHRNVWEQSGHWQKFQDPIIYDTMNRCLRLDKELGKFYPDIIYENLSHEQIKNYFEQINSSLLDGKTPKYVIPVWNPDKKELNIEHRNLMMVTKSGDQDVGLRPETATSTFNNFPDIKNYFKGQYPMKIFQIGKSFRNEISPKSPNNEAASIPDEFKLDVNILNAETNNIDVSDFWSLNINGTYYKQLIYLTYKLFLQLGIPTDKIRLRRHAENERAFYALDAWDIEVKLESLGWTEIAGMHDRGVYDLRHLEFKKDRPHVIEIAIGTDRLFYSVVDTLYLKLDKSAGKTTLQLPPKLATTQVAVLPIVSNKPEIVNIAQNLYGKIKGSYSTQYMPKQNIGKRYLRCSELGVPFCITVDHESVNDHMVTIRFRDTSEQIRVPIDNVLAELGKLF
jgi:glycyl-tRNA synthetase